MWSFGNYIHIFILLHLHTFTQNWCDIFLCLFPRHFANTGSWDGHSPRPQRSILSAVDLDEHVSQNNYLCWALWKGKPGAREWIAGGNLGDSLNLGDWRRALWGGKLLGMFSASSNRLEVTVTTGLNNKHTSYYLESQEANIEEGWWLQQLKRIMSDPGSLGLSAFCPWSQNACSNYKCRSLTWWCPEAEKGDFSKISSRRLWLVSLEPELSCVYF